MCKNINLSKLIKKLDDVFQMYIRNRDNFVCITCGKKFPKGEREECHAGHFIGRGIYSTRWDEENVNCQCSKCNYRQFLGDKEIINNYEEKLKLKYGKDVIERLFQKKHKVFKLTREFLEDKIKFYKNAVENEK